MRKGKTMNNTIYLVKETIDYKSDIETPVYVEAFKDYNMAVKSAKDKFATYNTYMDFTEDEEIINAMYEGYSHEGYNENTEDWYKVSVIKTILK